ncbi:MAG: ATP-binding cassette domain-containing protein [Lachnospiraceae bacterium]|nr:ATP-binding cassette domain-containing protein [Lachnospiraceae bacterium]
MLELHDICKEYRTGDTVQKALDHVNLTLGDTEFVAILGPSGSGKTTLLNIIGGLDRYDSGDLIIDGISTRNYTDRDWDAYRNHVIGFVFQSYNLIMHQSVLSNVELALTIAGVSGEERRRRAEEALRMVGLGSHMHKKPNQLSGGQMQRVAIARALVNNPKILLADEPTGALDSDTSVQVMNILKEVARDRLVVMVTHNPELAEQYATRIVTIRDGRFAGSRDLPENMPAEKTAVSAPGAALTQEALHPAADSARQGAGTAESSKAVVKNGRFRRTSMNFLTALELSFQNLRTKKARTLMVSFAGSIGIIGIALILAIETGLQQYVRNTESATLSQYPIEIYSTGIDWSSLLSESYGTALSMTSLSGSETDTKNTSDSDEIAVNTLAKDIFTGMNANDLVSFKKYLESGESDIDRYVTDIEYNYGVEPQIYSYDADGTPEQLNPNRMLSDMLTSIIDVSSLMNGIVGESIFHAMPSNEELYENSYDVRAGRWPENDHELVLVLTADGHISDFLLYELGIKDPDELRSMINKFSSGSDNSILSLAQSAVSVVGGSAEDTSGSDSETEADLQSDAGTSSGEDEKEVCHYSDFLGRQFKLILSSDTYVYDPDMNIWSDKSDDAAYMSDLVANGEDLTIVGIVQAKKGASNMMLTSGIGYPRGLIYELIGRESESEVVKQQLASPDTDIFTGRKFTDSGSAFDFGSLVTLDHDDVAKAFNVTIDSDSADTMQSYMASEINRITEQIVKYASDEAQSAAGSVSLSLSDFVDLDALQKEIPGLTQEDLNDVLNAAFSSLSEEALKQAVASLGTQYVDQLKKEAAADLAQGSDDAQLEQIFQSIVKYIGQYLTSDEAQQVLQEEVKKIVRENADQISRDVIQSRLQEEIQAYLSWVEKQNSSNASGGTSSSTQTGGSGPDQALKPDDPAVIALYLASQEGQQRISALAASIAQMSISISQDQLQQIRDALLQSFSAYAEANGIPELEQISSDLTQKLTDSFTDFLTSSDTRTAIQDAVTQVMDSDAVRTAVENAVQNKLAGIQDDVRDDITDKVSTAAQAEIASFAADVSGEAKRLVLAAIEQDYPQIAGYINSNIGDFFTVDEDAFRRAIKVSVGMPELQSILTSFLNRDKASLSGNLSSLGYADLDSPTEILIYPADFNAKNHIADLIDAYNKDVKSRGENDKAITYSDVVATMMQSITDIINSISRVLVAFVSISLVVSSIMIGVITYISVLERRKEIGILRAMGASKHNVREVFNAETIITGFISGCLGIGITYALIPFATYLIRKRTGQAIMVVLEPKMAGALVFLSIGLTLLAGLIPSGAAARSDPVTALRSE